MRTINQWVLLARSMYALAWSDGTTPERTPRHQREPEEEQPAQQLDKPTTQDVVSAALETRPGWRPEQFPGTDGRCRETASERIQARQPISRMTANPFLAGDDYLNTLALQDAFLIPKSSHARRPEST